MHITAPELVFSTRLPTGQLSTNHSGGRPLSEPPEEDDRKENGKENRRDTKDD